MHIKCQGDSEEEWFQQVQPQPMPSTSVATPYTLSKIYLLTIFVMSGPGKACWKCLRSVGQHSLWKVLPQCGCHSPGTPSFSRSRTEQQSCLGSSRWQDPLLVSPRGSSLLRLYYSAKLAGLEAFLFIEDQQREEDLTSFMWITRHSPPCWEFILISCMVVMVSSEILSMWPLSLTAVEHTGGR